MLHLSKSQILPVGVFTLCSLMTALSLSPASPLLPKAVQEGASLCLFVNCAFFFYWETFPSQVMEWAPAIETRHNDIAGVGGCGSRDEMLEFPC